MTDLSKGIIEIGGFVLDMNTTSADIKNKLNGLYANCATSKDGSVEIFRFKNIKLLDRYFEIMPTFFNQKLSDIQLIPYYADNLQYEERFQVDCEWLKNILGEPDKISDYTNSYYYEGIHIYSFIQRDLARSPAETFIVCSYET
jgi:hypothetical protein